LYIKWYNPPLKPKAIPVAPCVGSSAALALSNLGEGCTMTVITNVSKQRRLWLFILLLTRLFGVVLHAGGQ